MEGVVTSLPFSQPAKNRLVRSYNKSFQFCVREKDRSQPERERIRASGGKMKIIVVCNEMA